ncbi:MAG: superoxide dismutase family protein [Acidobacteriaceae bacterium]
MGWRWVSGLIAVGLVGTALGQVGTREIPKEVKVRLVNSAGQPAGTATFKTVKKGVKVKVELENVRFGEHALIIHENPVCDAPDFEGAGGHFNPSGKEHGFLNPKGHHNGDFPAGISVGEEHTGEATFVLTAVSLDPAAADSLFLHGGTSIVVHTRADDQKSDPYGDTGNRIACGVIRLPVE